MIAQPLPGVVAEAATPRTPRRAELWLAGIGAAASTVLLGGFSRVIGSVDAASFTDGLYPSFLAAVGASADELPPAAAFELARTLGSWFGFTLVGVLLLTAAGWWLARRRPNRRATGWWFAAAGLACLLGSQLLLFPVAFLFFVAAGLFALRPTTPRSITQGSPS